MNTNYFNINADWWIPPHISGRSQMTSCKNRQFLAPSLPSVIIHHDCLDPPPSEQKRTSSRPDPPPFELFQLFYTYNYIYISVRPSSNYCQWYGSENEFRNFYPLWRPNPTDHMTVAALATSLSIHQVLLAPLRVGANLQIRAPPLQRRQLWADSVLEFKAMIHSLLIFTVLNPDT